MINRCTCASMPSGTEFSTSSCRPCGVGDWPFICPPGAPAAALEAEPSRPVSLCDIRRITLTALSFKTSFASTFRPSTASSAVTLSRRISDAAASRAFV